MVKGKIIKIVGDFHENNIAKILAKYNKDGRRFFDFGWGNINQQMIQNEPPQINLNKKLISKYAQPQGLKELLNQIQKFIFHYSEKKQIDTNRILVTNGATNAIFLVSYYFRHFHNAKIVLVQNPTFDTALNIFRSMEFKQKCVKPNFQDLNRKTFDIAYCAFKFHNPTGLYIKEDVAEQIKANILKQGFLIEDDPYGLLTSCQTIPQINHPRHIYIGSFSKYLFPGIRMGFIIANKQIIEKMCIIQKYFNSHPNVISQNILLEYLKTGRIQKEALKKFAKRMSGLF